MKSIILNIICLLSVGLGTLQGQTLKAYLAAADEALTNQNYYAAQSYLKEALQFDQSNLELKYQYAEALKDFNAYTQAEIQFIEVMELDSTNAFPMTTYELASIQQKLGKHQEAILNYTLFASEYTGDSDIIIKANNEITALEWVAEQDSITAVDAEVTRLSDQINTAYSEFGGNFYEDEFYYSSLRFEGLHDEYDPKRIFAKILKADSDETAGVVMEEGEINNSKFNIAHSTFAPDGSMIIYTICDYENANDIRCDLYSRTVVDSTFGPEVMLPNFVNSPNHTSTQPHISQEKGSDEYTLYYSSDRPHPSGEDHGLDIYKMTMRADGTYTEPINVSDVNTLGDEVTPFYDSPSKTLYYSSDAGMRFGGFDIFRSVANGKGFQERVNLGKGINTSYNDLYYVLSPNGEEAYFSSNRLESNYLDELAEACCYDIYKAKVSVQNIKLDALTFLKSDLTELNGATVQLFDAASVELIDEVTNLDANNHLFDIESGREYFLIGSKTGYESDTIEFSTFGVVDPEIKKKLFLESKCIEMSVSTFEKLTGTALNGVQVEIEDLTDPSKPVIRKLDVNGNNYVVCLEPDKEYKITATKPGYDPMTTMIDTRGVDPAQIIEKKIYLTKKGKPLKSLLPLKLYFDNDEPDNRSIRLYTLKSYTDTYYPYISRKGEFKTRRSSPITGAAAKAAAAAKIESFFEQDVKGGYTQLQEFLTALTTRLQSGERYELQIEGYTSPLASNEYNKALGQRRVFSIKNELKSYQGGVLASYIDSGQLKIKDISYGEERAPSGISDQRSDTPNSIYSVEASKERRASIVDLIKLN